LLPGVKHTGQKRAIAAANINDPATSRKIIRRDNSRGFDTRFVAAAGEKFRLFFRLSARNPAK
jgi:hypothetical protein